MEERLYLRDGGGLVQRDAERPIVEAPEMKAAWDKQGAVAMSMSPDEFGHFMREDIEKWARVVKVSGAKADR